MKQMYDVDLKGGKVTHIKVILVNMLENIMMRMHSTGLLNCAW